MPRMGDRGASGRRRSSALFSRPHPRPPNRHPLPPFLSGQKPHTFSLSSFGLLFDFFSFALCFSLIESTVDKFTGLRWLRFYFIFFNFFFPGKLHIYGGVPRADGSESEVEEADISVEEG